MFPPQISTTLFFLLVLLSIVFSFTLASPLSTIAVSKVFNQTLVCALLPSPCHTRYDLNCTAFPSGRRRSYPSGTATYSAIAAGNGFLCALSVPPSSNLFSMRWWDFTKQTNSNGSAQESKRVYQGPALEALSAGDSHVCGILGDTGEPDCWRWPQLSFPGGLSLLEIAVGGDFVCGLLSSRKLKCFGGDSGVVGREPAGNYSLVAAGSRHACAISVEDALVCWGVGAPVVATSSLNQINSLALGENGTCALRANGTVVCWGSNIALPEDVADAQFITIEAKGRAFCGALMSNYSLICWGNEAFHKNSVVFERVLPGTCEAIPNCSCGLLPGSGDICISGAICQPCKLALKPIPAVFLPNSTVPYQSSGSSKTRLILLVLGAAGFGICVAAISSYSLFRAYNKSGRVYDSGRLSETALAPGTPGLVARPDLPGCSEPPIDRQPNPFLNKGHGSFMEEFPLDVLLATTNGFSEKHKIGSGSFGSVYRATLADGREVAIKRAVLPATVFSPSSSHAVSVHKKRRDKESAFLSELALLSRVNHRNLVRLLGYCRQGSERVLVYEFMTNGTLHDHLHKLDHSPLASWRARLRAALDAARGVEYLHAYAVPPIIHRDIKSSNILLDSTWTAKVSDFGLSLMNPDDEGTSQAPARAAGTVGYMDPEYYRLQHLTTKSDVYSFGVVLLELLTGSKVIQRYGESGTPRNVVEYAVPHIEADGVHRVLDARLPPPTPSEIEAVAYVGYLAVDCVSPAGRDRPTMTEVVADLELALAACDPAPFARSATTRSL